MAGLARWFENVTAEIAIEARPWGPRVGAPPPGGLFFLAPL